jgi:hypothetical protein
MMMVSARARTYLMRQHKDEGVGALDGLGQVRFGNNVVAEGDPGQVFHILVLLVDDLGQLAALELFPSGELPPIVSLAEGSAHERERASTHLLLEAPHVNFGLEAVAALLDVLSDEVCNGRSPVATACERECITTGVSRRDNTPEGDRME